MSVNTPGSAILGSTLLDIYSSGNSNVATFGHSNADLRLRFYDSNLPYANKNYSIGLCNIDASYQSNALYIAANDPTLTRIGIGTAQPASIMEIYGKDALRSP
jgi:hypothetical protein